MGEDLRLAQAKDAVEVIRAYTSHKADFAWDDFPRNIEYLIIFGLELPLITAPVLTIQSAAEYLCLLNSNNVPQEITEYCSLYGLLHVGPPFNAIFIRADLPLQIRYYVLAHELGHFVADVLSVQQIWRKALTEREDAILRAFSWQDFDVHLELSALIKGLPNRPKTVTGRGAELAEETAEREIIADLFARELLAPWDRICPLFGQGCRHDFVSLLHEHYYLPRRIASYYYDDLRLALIPPPSMLDRLFAHCLP